MSRGSLLRHLPRCLQVRFHPYTRSRFAFTQHRSSIVAPPPQVSTLVQPASAPALANDARRISDEEALSAIRSEVEQHCCWGKSPAQKASIEHIDSTNAFTAALVTWVEERSTSAEFVPYVSGMVDGPEYGLAPAPWMVNVPQPPLFKNTEMKVELPHTSTVASCHECNAMGMIRCERCRGWGTCRCCRCDGRGVYMHRIVELHLLDNFVGNENGILVVGGSNFRLSSRDVKIEGHSLAALCQRGR